MENPNTTMTCINCDCLKETTSKSVVPYIDHTKCNVTNLKEKKPLATILKKFADRFNLDCLVTKEYPITVIKIYFKATIKLTSITIKSTCKKMKIFRGNSMYPIDWRTEKEFQEVPLNEHFVTTHCAESKYGEITNMLLVLEGEKKENKIFYLDLKGSFLGNKQQPIITKYELFATEVHPFAKNCNSLHLV